MKKKLLKLSLLSLSFLIFGQSYGQIIFEEDFGNEQGRQICKYLPTSNSYIFADTTGIGAYSEAPWSIPSELLKKVLIENGHYAVVPIQKIGQGFFANSSFGWMWTGPAPYAENPSWQGQPMTTVTDHTPTYNDTGAVLVVNAGNAYTGDNPQKPIYVRSVQLEPSTTYKLSYSYYIVNPSSNISILVRDGISYGTTFDPIDGIYLAKKDLGLTSTSSTDGIWQTDELVFTTQSGCEGSNYEIMLFNLNPATGGNDFYIDDIILEQSTETGTLLSGCPTLGKTISGTVIDSSSTSVDLSDYFVSLIDDKGDVYMTVPVDPVTGTYEFVDVMYNTFNIVIHKNPNGELNNNINSDISISEINNATVTPIIVTTSTIHNELDIVFINNTPLNIQILSFDAKLNGNEVVLDWTTTNDANTINYEIERSNDGMMWKKIGSINSLYNKDKNISINEYLFTDKQPLSDNFYRLKQIKADGKFQYSETRHVNYLNKIGIYLFPNPTNDLININGLIGEEEVVIYDHLGKIQYRTTISLNKASIDISNQLSGIYVIQIIRNNEIIYIDKIVKK